MPVTYLTNGPGLVYVSGTILGSSGNQFLGISRDRIRANINHYDGKIPSDNAGPVLGADWQYFGKDATIRVSLTQLDTAVLDAIERLGQADAGLLANIGAPMAQSGMTFQLKIPSNYKPWTFNNVILRPRGDAVGTEFTVIDLEFYAFSYIGNNTLGSNNRLFSHTFS